MRRCTAAFVAESVRTVNDAMHGATTKAMPKAFAHGTTAANGLNIARAGHILPSPGIAGTGIYAFEVADPTDEEALRAAWQRGKAGGYNHGCMWVMQPCHGIVIKGLKHDTPIPCGAVANKRDRRRRCFGRGVHHFF